MVSLNERAAAFAKVNTGSGSSSGFGFGDGYGDISRCVKQINGMPVVSIDGIATAITAVHGNIARGYIVNDDMTMKACYIVKNGNTFAHGETLEKALSDLQSKLFANMDTGERIEAFIAEHKHEEKRTGTHFLEWHNKLTGSCELGRSQFVKSNNLDVDALYSVDEFIAITENAFGGEIIKELKEKWREKTNGATSKI